jgi:hypothetical protein
MRCELGWLAPLALLVASCNSLLGNQPGLLADAATPCGDDLSNIGTGDFRIAFTFTTTAPGVSALFNQRAVCDHGDFWDIRLGNRAPGGLNIETDDGRHYSEVSTEAPLNDGRPHAIVVSRIGGEFSVDVDGVWQALDYWTTTPAADFAELPALKRGIDVCQPLGTQVFMGTLGDVCVTH